LPLLQKLFNRAREPRINVLSKEAVLKECPLLDVRTPEEFASGHIPGSVNLPLQTLDQITVKYPDMSQPIYLYCRSGSRSKQAKKRLLQLGYKTVHDLGGILHYQGILQK